MSTPRPFGDPARPPPAAQLSLSVRPLAEPTALPGATGQILEFSARGERVNARLLAPHAGSPPRPLALFVHDEVEGIQDASARRALESGAALLDMNWPLTGTRRSPKMSLQLIAALKAGQAGSRPSPLVSQFFAQAQEELACLFTAARELPELDAETLFRIDLRLVPDRSGVANADDELFAPCGPSRTFVRENFKGGRSDDLAQGAMAEFLASLLA
jgi:hypothetical protein